jgi:hypothetical protein
MSIIMKKSQNFESVYKTYFPRIHQYMMRLRIVQTIPWV